VPPPQPVNQLRAIETPAAQTPATGTPQS
jgi:hypothetical protein